MDKNHIFDDLENYQDNLQKLKTLELMKGHVGDVKSHAFSMIGGNDNSLPGNPTEKAFKKLQEIEQEYETEILKLTNKLSRISTWVKECPDGFIANACYWHYIRGLDWGKTCVKVYGYHNYSTCRKAVMRYFGREK